jgi:thiol-disulfide isomerase/thioredoxin
MILLIGVTSTLFAESIFTNEQISAVMNSLNIKVNDNEFVKIGEGYITLEGVEVPSTIIYEDTTYICLRKMEEILNLQIQYDSDNRTITINNNNFIKSNIDDIKNTSTNEDLILFYIGSPDCPACRVYAPKLNKVIEKFEDIDTVSYINIKELSEEEKNYLRNTFDLKYIPATLFIEKGKIAEKIVGDLSEEKLYQTIENVLNLSSGE